ncbi:MAG: XRE family transcriptional regulator [Bacteriovorax sp.]|nr:XRE family transcriptional regulator [Bacteriovorax sp.]
MAYPTKEQIISIMSDIEKQKKNGKIGTLKPLAKNATPLIKWKFKLSQKIAEFRVIKGLSLDDMSNLLNTDKANISRIVNGHIEKVTLDKLIQYFEIILIASKNKKASEKFHASADKFFEFDDVRFG